MGPGASEHMEGAVFVVMWLCSSFFIIRVQSACSLWYLTSSTVKKATYLFYLNIYFVQISANLHMAPDFKNPSCISFSVVIRTEISQAPYQYTLNKASFIPVCSAFFHCS